MDNVSDASHLLNLLTRITSSNYEKAFAYSKSGEHIMAAEAYHLIAKAYHKAVEVINKHPQLIDLKELSKSFDQTGNYWDKQTEDSRSQAIRNESKTFIVQGDQLRSREDYKESVKYYDKAIEIDSKSALAWSNKGYALSNLDKSYYDESIKCFDKAIEIDSKYKLAWNNKGYALEDLGKKEQAIEDYDKVLWR
jgi:tetratricopeptide (TPR) repeat protein